LCGSFNPGSQADGTNSDARHKMKVLGKLQRQSGSRADGRISVNGGALATYMPASAQSHLSLILSPGAAV